MSQTETQTECKRCGQCCLHGGPALHGRDMKLLEDGKIERKHLITYLKGELLKDPVSGSIMPLNEELVKLKTLPGTTTCVFYVQDTSTCAIYARRPAECRAQKCWDPDKLLAMYEVDRLQRRSIVNQAGGLGELMNEHEEKCGRKRIQQLSRKVGSDEAAENELLELLKYDEAMRDLVSERIRIPRDDLEFYFGRPVAMILPTFGVKVQRYGGSFKLTKLENPVPEQDSTSAGSES